MLFLSAVSTPWYGLFVQITDQLALNLLLGDLSWILILRQSYHDLELGCVIGLPES